MQLAKFPVWSGEANQPDRKIKLKSLQLRQLCCALKVVNGNRYNKEIENAFRPLIMREVSMDPKTSQWSISSGQGKEEMSYCDGYL